MVKCFSGPIKEDSNFKDDDPSVDYVDIIGTEEQLVSILLRLLITILYYYWLNVIEYIKNNFN